ncbi:MAG: NrdH-redoxin [Bacteroidetes bacterium]|nr:NrdH-redoxin [Bacteroidota bacterium]
MTEVTSYNELQKNLKEKDKSYLLLYKPGSKTSDCAYTNVNEAEINSEHVQLLVADVTKTRDIHPKYNVISAPALLEFENGSFKNVIKGCNDSNFYKTLFEEAVYFVAVKNDDKPQKSVTVYSTPTCTWCNTLKMFLRKHHIRFTDIDVSRDQRAAEELVRRSGQTGVPQTEIDGEMIVGFNQARISELLGIKK